jgi:hypothetical protein
MEDFIKQIKTHEMASKKHSKGVGKSGSKK